MNRFQVSAALFEATRETVEERRFADPCLTEQEYDPALPTVFAPGRFFGEESKLALPSSKAKVLAQVGS